MLKKYAKFPLVLLAVLLAAVPSLAPSYVRAENAPESGFGPTWKLMSKQERKVFISGYLQAWRDAAKVNDIAIGFIKENPQKAVGSLEQIKSLYDMSGLDPDTMLSKLDRYFADPDHVQSTLSMAMSATK